MTAVRVRYRDVPYSVVVGCLAPGDESEFNETDWNNLRGKFVDVHIPPIDPADIEPAPRCGGSFYTAVKKPTLALCSHYIEIGD